MSRLLRQDASMSVVVVMGMSRQLLPAESGPCPAGGLLGSSGSDVHGSLRVMSSVRDGTTPLPIIAGARPSAPGRRQRSVKWPTSLSQTSSAMYCIPCCVSCGTLR